VQNEGNDTQVALSSGDSGQQQNQSTGFNTGEWSKPPELFRISEKLVLRIESKSRPKFISIHGNQIESMGVEPKLENAKELTFNEAHFTNEANGAHQTHGADEANETDELSPAFIRITSPGLGDVPGVSFSFPG
jgi:hypothetical protein